MLRVNNLQPTISPFFHATIIPLEIDRPYNHPPSSPPTLSEDDIELVGE